MMSQITIIGEFINFIKERKKWWLLPIVLLILIVGAMLVVVEGSAVAPFIYALF